MYNKQLKIYNKGFNSMKNDNNYCLNCFWFDMYDEARWYADFIMETQRRYYAIFTRAEIEAHGEENMKAKGNTSSESWKRLKSPLKSI